MQRKARIKVRGTTFEQVCKCRRCSLRRQHRKPGRGKWAKRQINRRIRHLPFPTEDDE